MEKDKIILDFIKSENKNLEIFGLRGLVKTGESEWSFRYTYRDGDSLSISTLNKVNMDSNRKVSFLKNKKTKKITQKSTIK